jgi:hypothetical protein
MRFSFRMLLAFPLGAMAVPLWAASGYDTGKQLWQDAKYREAYEMLWPYRETTPYGRTAQVDYMLGTSGCRLPDLRVWGGNVLDWMLRRYALSEPSRKIVAQQLSECRTTSRELAAVDGATVAAIENMIGSTARASGKTFYWVGRNEDINSYPARRVRDIPRETLEARLVRLGQADEAVRTVKARVPEFDVHVYNRFIIAARTGDEVAILDKTARYLDRYLEFLGREYGVALPPYYVTLYMVKTSDELGRLGEQLHGMKVGRATFGYSFRDDMSVLAAVPGGFGPGTLMHELFHLVVRSQFGDIPQWMDEGLASLYEVSKFDGDRVVGMPNWRGQVLKRLESKRPTLRQLIARDWFAFEQPEMTRWLQQDEYMEAPPAEYMAATLATARYFTLYLQDRGKLKAIYQSLRDQQPSRESNQNVPAATIAIIQGELGKDIDEVDADFIRWFHSVEGAGTSPAHPIAGNAPPTK